MPLNLGSSLPHRFNISLCFSVWFLLWSQSSLFINISRFKTLPQDFLSSFFNCSSNSVHDSFDTSAAYSPLDDNCVLISQVSSEAYRPLIVHILYWYSRSIFRFSSCLLPSLTPCTGSSPQIILNFSLSSFLLSLSFLRPCLLFLEST